MSVKLKSVREPCSHDPTSACSVCLSKRSWAKRNRVKVLATARDHRASNRGLYLRREKASRRAAGILPGPQYSKDIPEADGPCSHNGTKACLNCASKRRYKLRNKKALSEYNRKRYAAMPECQRKAILTRQKELAAKDPERRRMLCRRSQRGWSEKQKQRKRDRDNARYAANPEPAKDKAKYYNALARGASEPESVLIVKLSGVWERDGGLCGICGRPVRLDFAHLDHIVPTSKGGPHTADNCQAAHPGCNSRKRNRSALRVLPAIVS